MKEDKRRDNRYNKNDDFIAGITNVLIKSAAVVCGLQLGWVMSIAGMVES